MSVSVTLEMIYDEVKKVNEKLGLIEDVIDEVLTRSLREVKLSDEEAKEIEDSVTDMRKGEYVTLEELKGA